MWALIAVVTLAVPDAGFDQEEALGTYLRKGCSQVDHWPTGDGLQRSACSLLLEEPVPEHFAEAVQRVARAWNVPLEVADVLLTIEVFREAVEPYSGAPRLKDGWAARYASALAAAPSSPAVLAALVAGQEHGATAQQLEDALAASPKLAKSILHSVKGLVRANVEAFALAQDPSALALDPESPAPPEAPLSFKVQRLRQAIAEKDPSVGLPGLYRMVLEDALSAGLDSLAVELWSHCPKAVMPEVLRDHRELRLELAVAAIGIGDDRLAATLVPRAAPPSWPLRRPPDELVNADHVARYDCRIQVLEEAIARRRDPKRAARDSFALVIALGGCYLGPPLSVPLARMLHDQPEAARLRLGMSPRSAAWMDGSLPTRATQFVRPAQDELARAREKEAQAVARELGTLPVKSAADPGHELLMRLLGEPQPNPWAEGQPLGPKITIADDDTPPSVPGAKDLQLPPGSRRFASTR